MKSLIPFTLAAVIFCLLPSPAAAAFSSMYVFGDTLCATTNIVGKPSAPGGSAFYGQRWSNGRVWVEALAQFQGIPFQDVNNYSYYDHSSSNLVGEIPGFTPPPSITNALCVIWVANADTFDVANIGTPSSAVWNTAITAATNNYFKIITNLYSKGVRALVMPNAVDISKIPAFNRSVPPLPTVMSNGCVAYNAALASVINQAGAVCPGLTIYTPDFFRLLNNVLTNAAAYGLTNALDNGFPIDAIDDPNLNYLNISNGLGPSHIFWDTTDPTAKLHFTMAGYANALISPPVITNLQTVGTGSQLNFAGLPVAPSDATNCLVLSATNLNQPVWQTNLPGFSSTNAVQSVIVPRAGPQGFYRLQTSLVFSWPWVWP